MKRIRSTDFMQPGQVFHVARSVFQGARVSPLHDHDFFEAWWIDSGHALVLGSGGKEERRDKGSLAFVIPEDVHGFHPIWGAPFTLSNLAFPAETVSGFRELHADFFSGSSSRRSFDLEPASLTRVEAAFDRLVRGRRERLDLESFLTSLMVEARDSRGESGSMQGLPDWLADSLRRLLGEGQPVRGVVSRLADISGRSREHLSRVVRSATGMTTVTYIRSLQLEAAAIKLALSDEGVAKIALDCGFENLGHFYAVFRRARGMSPAQYRKRARDVVVGT